VGADLRRALRRTEDPAAKRAGIEEAIPILAGGDAKLEPRADIILPALGKEGVGIVDAFDLSATEINVRR